MTVREPASLECKEVVELVTDFLGDALTPVDRARIEQHLLVCPPCTQHVAQVRFTVAHLAALRVERVPTEVSPALVDVFRRVTQKRGGHEGA